MRKVLMLALLAGVAAPAFAQEDNGPPQTGMERREAAVQARAERGSRPDAGPRPDAGSRPDRPSFDRGARPDRAGFERGPRPDRTDFNRDTRPDRPDFDRGDRPDRPGFGDRPRSPLNPAVPIAPGSGGYRSGADRDRDGRPDWNRDRNDGRRDWDRDRDGRPDWNRSDDGRRWDGDRGRDDPGWDGNRSWDGNRGWNGGDRNYRSWNRNWRNDRRYDWQRYRTSNRSAYRLPRYYAPRGWGYGYRRFSIGVTLFSGLYAQDYWINDPYEYRLPPAEWPYRWVRYYDDAILVDTRTGVTVDVISGIFW